MKFIPAGATVKVARTALQFKKNSPAIMFGAGITSVAISTVLACKSTLKFDEVMTSVDEKRKEMVYAATEHADKYTEKDLDKDLKLLKIQTGVKIAKLYAPAAIVGLIGVGLLTGSHITLTKRNAALTAAYAVLDRGFNEYRSRVREELGEEKDREFRFGAELKEIVEEGENGHEVKTVKRFSPVSEKIYAREFNPSNKHWSNHPADNRNFIFVIQNWMNDKLRANGHVFLNDVYRALGFDDTKQGAVVGWVKDGKNKDGEVIGDGYIDFGLGENDDRIEFFMKGESQAILLDFNVDGIVYDLI